MSLVRTFVDSPAHLLILQCTSHLPKSLGVDQSDAFLLASGVRLGDCQNSSALDGNPIQPEKDLHHVRENNRGEGKTVEVENETGNAGEEEAGPRRVPGMRGGVFSASGAG